MKKIVTAMMAAVFCVFNMVAQSPINHTYPQTDGPDKNPMKGWSSGWWDNFDQSSVGFQYIKWKDLEPTDGAFDIPAVENVIDRPGSQGKHLILRLYVDWFGDDPISDAGPQWIYDDYGVARLQAPNGKYITDFNNPNFITQITEAITELANEYNNDPRIYSIQIGMLGYWGEWHAFTFNDPNFEIETTTKAQILNTCKSLFSNAKLMGRQPWDEPLTSTGGIGFHNDFFIPNNGHSDEFDDAIAAGEKWKEGPIGGENPPIDVADREQYMTDLYETPTGMNMITTGHYSTMKLGNELRPCDSDPTGARCQGFMDLHRKMGYNYQIEVATFPEVIDPSDNLDIELALKNIGVAPIYYDWDVQFALLDDNNIPVKTFDPTYDLTTIMADESIHTITSSEALLTVPEGNYQLAVRIIQPEAANDKLEPWKLDARNAYVLFSNDLPTIDGAWNVNNALEGGWSVLGPVAVQESIVAVSNVLIYHETNGFRHGSINNGINLITNLGITNGRWTTTETQDSSNFNATTLADYDLVIWCNTSGNGLLTTAEQQAFETWITNGGAFMGIHAATDTYRDGSWPYYNELVGGIVQTGPNHTPNNHNDDMDILEKHPSTDHLDAVWNKTEEYYYWELNGGQLSTDNTNVLFVEETGGDSYDAARPMAWYKTSVTVNGVTTPARSFYTALGHNGSDYNNDTDFQQHIEGAIIWALPAEVTTYVGGAWDNNAPDRSMRAVIAESYDTALLGNITARDLIVNSGAILTVAPNSFIEIGENITVNGSLIVEHQGSVVQNAAIGTVTNNETINVKLTTPDLDSRDFMMLGSPMTSDNVNNVWDDAFLVLKHNTLNFVPNPDVAAAMPGAENFADDNYDNWSGFTGAITPTEGYIVRPQAALGAPGGVFNYAYNEGTLNNGTLGFDIIYQQVGDPTENRNHSPNILANPYASAISADDFINANAAVEEVFFWEHLTPPSPDIPGAGAMNFSIEDISMYNLTGGTAAANDPTNATAPNGFISTGQGFMIKANSDSDVVFTNRMRRNDNNTTLRKITVHPDRLWLSVTNDDYNMSKSTLIGFNSTTTANLDSGYDSKRLATIVSLYSQLPDGSGQLGIQSREAFNDDIIIPLGFSTQIDAELRYKISIANLEGENLSSARVYLLDRQTNLLTNISQDAYEFTSVKGTFHNRFVLQFKEDIILDTNSFEKSNVIVYPNPTTGPVTIVAPLEIKSVYVYDVSGRLVLETHNSSELNLETLNMGVYLAEIIADNNEKVTKRIIKQ